MKKKSVILSGVALALLVGVGTQVSVLALGDAKDGSTIVVRRSDWLGGLRLIDSGKAHCTAATGDTQARGETPAMTMRRLAAEACHDELAIRIMDERRALARFSYSGAVMWASEIGR